MSRMQLNAHRAITASRASSPSPLLRFLRASCDRPSGGLHSKSERTLFINWRSPSLMSEKTTTAKHRWSDRVEAHHAQSESVKDDSFRSDDFWRPFASDFRQDPRRRDDAALNRLFPYIGPEQTVLDVGGGAGRFALPLALRCRHVTIVDPSDSMLEEARSTAQEVTWQHGNQVGWQHGNQVSFRCDTFLVVRWGASRDDVTQALVQRTYVGQFLLAVAVAPVGPSLLEEKARANNCHAPGESSLVLEQACPAISDLAEQVISQMFPKHAEDFYWLCGTLETRWSVECESGGKPRHVLARRVWPRDVFHTQRFVWDVSSASRSVFSGSSGIIHVT